MDIKIVPAVLLEQARVRVPRGISEVKKMKKVSPGLSPSIREYVRRIYKTADLNCEQVGHCLVFEAELNAWIEEVEKKEEEIENGN